MESREEAPKSLITKGGARGKGTGGFGFGFGWRYLGLSHPRPAPRALGPGSLLSTATVTPARLEELPSPTEATGLEASGEAQWRSGSICFNIIHVKGTHKLMLGTDVNQASDVLLLLNFNVFFI